MLIFLLKVRGVRSFSLFSANDAGAERHEEAVGLEKF